MNYIKRFWIVGLLAVAVVVLGATAALGSGHEALAIEIGTDGDHLAFDPATLSLRAGQQVTLRFKNNAARLRHNWVLVRGGETAAAAVNQAGLAAGPGRDFIPIDHLQIIASTGLLDGGETAEVTFIVPETGTYTFFCIFPGHYEAGMRGSLVVEP